MWADTPTKRTWFAVTSRRHSVVISSGFPSGDIVLAQKVQTLFVDDVNGSEADGTVRFGLDGTEYETT
jgi:Lsr2